MKSFAIIAILTVGILSAVAYAGEIPEGKYVFSAPALFGSTKDEARGKVCELEATESGYQLIFLNNPLSRGSRITFSIQNGRIVFDKSHMSSSEIGRTVTGKGKMSGSAAASGKLTISSGSMGFLLAERESSEWSLRPATRREVLDSYAEGLEMAEKLLWSNRAIERPSRENAIKALHSVVGYGFTSKDVPELEQMLESGDLNYKDGKFFFRQTSPDDRASSGLPISTNVTTETIDLREKINAPISVVTMQVVEVGSTVESNPAPSVVDIPEPSEPVVEEAPKQIDIEPIPEPQEPEGTSSEFPFGLIALGAALFLLLAIATILYHKKPR